MFDLQTKDSTPKFNMIPLVQHSLVDGKIVYSILCEIYKKTSQYTPSPEELACCSEMFQTLHIFPRSTIITTNIEGNLAWVPLIDICQQHQNEEKEMILGEIVHVMFHFFENSYLYPNTFFPLNSHYISWNMGVNICSSSMLSFKHVLYL